MWDKALLSPEHIIPVRCELCSYSFCLPKSQASPVAVIKATENKPALDKVTPSCFLTAATEILLFTCSSGRGTKNLIT